MFLGCADRGDAGAARGLCEGCSTLDRAYKQEVTWADAQFVKWLMEHQKDAGVFATMAGLVDQLSDNPAAKMTAQEIIERVSRAQGKVSG